MEKLRIGLIGSGVSGGLHVDAVAAADDCEIVALADRDQATADAAARRFGIPAAFGDYRDMLDQVDIVHNSTPNHLHAEINAAVLAAGKHLLAEKPLALTSQESAAQVELAREARARGVVSGICFIFRFKDSLQAIRDDLRSGAYGDVHFVRGGYLQDWLLLEDDFSWRIQPEFSGPSNCMADLGSHWCDLVEFVTGHRIRRVCARLGTLHPARRGPDGVVVATELDDHGAVLCELEGGAIAACAIGQTTAGRENRIHLEVDAGGASFLWDGDEPTWRGWRLTRGGEPHETKPPVPGPDELVALINDFNAEVRAVGDGRAHTSQVATFEDGHHVMQVLDAIVASDRSGGWIEVGAHAGVGGAA